MTNETDSALIDTARDIAGRIRAMRDEIEEGRRLPLPLVQEMKEAGFFRLMAPRALGGTEADPLTVYRVIEEVAKADGSAGWVLMIGVTGGFFVHFFNEQLGAELYRDPSVVFAGSLNPRGRALAVDGGYRVSGRWPFVSGVEHAAWVAVACLLVGEDGALITGPDGQPVMRAMVIPWEEVTIHDTWSVGGLRGTGSHDVSVDGAYVPAHRTFTVAGPPQYPGPLAAAFPIAPSMVAAVSLGIARGAIDAFIELAGTATGAGGNDPLRERVIVQLHVAQAEAIIRAARAGLLEAVREAWEAILGERTVAPELAARVQLAATHAAAEATRALDLLYAAGGSGVLYTRHPLERALRDVHAAGQHAAVQRGHYEATGRVLLGLPAGRSSAL